MPRSPFMTSPALLLLALFGCNGPEDTDKQEDSNDVTDWVDTYVQPVDDDADGQSVEDGDCDDSNPDVYTGRAEDCDGDDDNCNGLADEGFGDSDMDGTADCTDVEECDGIDNNGDGVVDEGQPDVDGDGVADCVGTERCDGFDNDGDGDVDEGFDSDGDGYTSCGSSTREPDCDDANGAVYPGAAEAASDGIDNNCDGLIDEGQWAAGDFSISEVMTNPQAVGDPEGEWIEIHNDSSRTLTMNGLILMSTDGDWHQVISSETLSVAPGGFFTFGTNDDMDSNGQATVAYEYTGISLSNESDDIWIYAGDVLIDSFAWDDGATLPDPVGASIMIDPGLYGATSNDNPTNWCAAIYTWGADPTGDKGSPMAENEVCSTYDHDGDGFSGDQGDCDDLNDTVYPGAHEGDATLDNDCDGDVEDAPTAVAALSGTAEACSNFQLDGSGSSDPTESSLTYAWSLVSAPGSSNRTSADIDTQTSMNPTFNPDVPGDYTFSLTVNDGGTNSYPDSLVVTVETRGSNNDPVASAGADQSYGGSGACQAISYGASYDCDDCSAYNFTLSGTGSSDPDGDRFEYLWSPVSQSAYATLSDTSDDTLTVSYTTVPSSYGVTTNEVTTLDLTVTDCLGASNTDQVTVTYSCTGS